MDSQKILPAERWPRQKTSKIFKKCQKVFSKLFEVFRAGQKNVKNRDLLSTNLFDLHSRAAPVFRTYVWGDLKKLFPKDLLSMVVVIRF